MSYAVRRPDASHGPTGSIGASAQQPPTATVLEYICLFTHDLRRKQKRWQDGRLKYHTFNQKVMVYDERGGFVGDAHWQGGSPGEDLYEGEELELDRGSAIVQVAECVGSKEQDLTEVLDRRAREVEKRRAEAAGKAKTRPTGPGAAAVAGTPGRMGPSAAAVVAATTTTTTPVRPAGLQVAPTRHRPLSSVMPSPGGRIGRAAISAHSPYEARQQQRDHHHHHHQPQQQDDGQQQDMAGGIAPLSSKRRRLNDGLSSSPPPPSKAGWAQSLFGTKLTLSATPLSTPPIRHRPLRDTTNVAARQASAEKKIVNLVADEEPDEGGKRRVERVTMPRRRSVSRERMPASGGIDGQRRGSERHIAAVASTRQQGKTQVERKQLRTTQKAPDSYTMISDDDGAQSAAARGDAEAADEDRTTPNIDETERALAQDVHMEDCDHSDKGNGNNGRSNEAFENWSAAGRTERNKTTSRPSTDKSQRSKTNLDEPMIPEKATFQQHQDQSEPEDTIAPHGRSNKRSKHDTRGPPAIGELHGESTTALSARGRKESRNDARVGRAVLPDAEEPPAPREADSIHARRRVKPSRQTSASKDTRDNAEGAAVAREPEKRTELRIKPTRKRGLLLISERSSHKLDDYMRSGDGRALERATGRRTVSIESVDGHGRPRTKKGGSKEQSRSEEMNDAVDDHNAGTKSKTNKDATRRRRLTRSPSPSSHTSNNEASLFIHSSDSDSDDMPAPAQPQKRPSRAAKDRAPPAEDKPTTVGPRISRMARKSVKSKEIFGFMPPSGPSVGGGGGGGGIISSAGLIPIAMAHATNSLGGGNAPVAAGPPPAVEPVKRTNGVAGSVVGQEERANGGAREGDEREKPPSVAVEGLDEGEKTAFSPPALLGEVNGAGEEMCQGMASNIAIERLSEDATMPTPPAPAPCPTPAPAQASATAPVPQPHRIANPATRGRKAATREHAAGKVPEPMLPLEPVTITAAAPRMAPRAAAAASATTATATAPGKVSSLPGFTKANGGAWSKHAEDLLGMTRPEGKGLRR